MYGSCSAGRASGSSSASAWCWRSPRSPRPSVRRLGAGRRCGVRVEAVDDPLVQRIRYLDQLVDELAKGRPLSEVLRSSRSVGARTPPAAGAAVALRRLKPRARHADPRRRTAPALRRSAGPMLPTTLQVHTGQATDQPAGGTPHADPGVVPVAHSAAVAAAEAIAADAAAAIAAEAVHTAEAMVASATAA